ncbi:hypothetical protein LQR31_11980 [Chromobacterium vaccinii]|uniref:hypothetical protein n=1 Tax=Chromobacterium vaccinii TaxID=1108595 RepID=UPI001E3611CD|nr:hypothetical protein [Chromobacterium vaccinii]MCD4485196.1 hypothetical protein [Chromobacterium vaccinii]
MSTVNIPVYERQLAAVLPEELQACYFRGEVPESMRQRFDEWKASAFLDGAPPASMTESNVAKFFLRAEALGARDALGAVALSVLFPMSNAPITALDTAAVRRAAVAGHAQLARELVDMAIHPADVAPANRQPQVADRRDAEQAQLGAANIDRNLLDFFQMRGNAKYRKDLMINVALEEAHGAKGLAERVERRIGVLAAPERGWVRRLLDGESPVEVMKDARRAKAP